MGLLVVADREGQHPAGLPVGGIGEGEQVGALPDRGMRPSALAEVAGVTPLPEVGGAEDRDVVIHGDDHHPRLRRLMPEDLGVAEVLAAVIGDDGVAVVAPPGAAAVRAVSEGLRLPASGRGVDRDHPAAGHQPGGVGAVVDAAAGHRQAQCVVLQGRAKRLPVHHVRADGVRPGAVLLMEQVVFAVEIDQAVGVGEIPLGGAVMVGGTERVRGIAGRVCRKLAETRDLRPELRRGSCL